MNPINIASAFKLIPPLRWNALFLSVLFFLPLMMFYNQYFKSAMIVLGKLRAGEPLDFGENELIGNASPDKE